MEVALPLVGQATLAVVTWMFLLWLLHLPLRNASIVDFGWPFGILICTVIFAFGGAGTIPRRFLLFLMVAMWAFRLGGYLLLARVVGKPEEGRYVALRQQWGANIELKFLAFFMMQAISCVVLSLPFLLVAMNDEINLLNIERLAAALFVIAMSCESIADRQLAAFKAKAENHGKVCRDGLWAWSRHPNYFFEWVIWMSFALLALPAPWGFLGFLSPTLILHFVLNVTGIPPTEEQAVRSKGDAYRLYQKEVSAFVPMPPKLARE
jgi:steroid 5-alpha reductase family enzyme